MKDDEGAPGARPVPVPPAVHDLIRQVAPERTEPSTPKRTERTASERAEPAPSGREFTVDGEVWLARIAGEGVGGTGTGAVAFLVAVRFYSAAAPEQAVREVLIPRGRFEMLYDEELVELFRTARPLSGS
jgi:hypothetical protein